MLLIMKDSCRSICVKGELDIGEAIEKTTMGLRTERSILTDSSGIEKNMYNMRKPTPKMTTISANTEQKKLIAEVQGFPMKEGAFMLLHEYTKTYAGRVAQLTAAMIDEKLPLVIWLIPMLNAMPN